MKFTIETIKTLHGYNANGSKVAISEGDEVYLKLNFPHMNLSDPERWIQTYPDGWVKGRIHNISNAGKSIMFNVYNFYWNYLRLSQSDILDVSDKTPRR
jgi:hypothetical protein